MSLVLLAMFAAVFCAKVESIGNAAFFAAIKTGYTLGKEQVVKYDTVLTNVGDAFDKSTSIFTARKRGIYVFHFNTLSNINSHCAMGLYRNNAAVVGVSTNVLSGYPMGGNTAVLRLERGDRVYVKTYIPCNIYGFLYTSFSGYLIELGEGEE